jgi:hypothetical protein
MIDKSSWDLEDDTQSNDWGTFSNATPLAEQGMSTDMYKTLIMSSSKSEYWRSSLKFIESIGDKHFKYLSSRQQDWAYDIIADVRVETDRRIAKEVWEGIKPGNLAVFLDSSHGSVRKD